MAIRARKVLILGGSFDPPHAGHAALLQAARRRLKPDLTLIVPAFHSPFKAAHAAPPKARLALTRALARSQGGRVQVERLELDRGRTTYTIDLARQLRKRYPQSELWLAIGGDNVASIKKWRRFKTLDSLVGWAVAARGNRPDARFGSRVILLKDRMPDVSSTELRAKLLAGISPSRLTARPVAAAIARLGLYGVQIRQRLKQTLKPRRYEHTLAVARLAVELARLHGEPPEKAALAALLHDAGRRFDPAQMARFATKHKLAVALRGEIIRRNPLLLHAYISANLAQSEFGVADPDVLNAIAHHTLGAVPMSRLERLVYVADLAAEDRGFPEAARIRTLARKNLDRAFIAAVRKKHAYVRSTGDWLHPMTARVLAWARKSL